MDKFKNTEELAKAYKELEREFTKKSQQVSNLKKSAEDKTLENIINKIIENYEKQNKEIEQISNFDLQKELMNSFFGGYYYITFENEDEKKSFFEYIESFDLRFRYDKKTDFICYKEVAWKFSKTLHHHQIEFASEYGYWKKKDIDINELKFSKVADYIKTLNQLRQSDFVKSLEMFFKGENQ